MNFRARSVGAVSAITLVTLGGAFLAVYLAVTGRERQRLDRALIEEAREEAREAAALGGDALAISERPGPMANDLGPLTKYAVIYEPDGSVAAETPTWRGCPPGMGELPAEESEPFDYWFGAEHLRAVRVPVPTQPEAVLLLAAPRTYLDRDQRSTQRTVLTVFALALLWTIGVVSWVMQRLTRGHAEIAAVARRVAAGDLAARVRADDGDAETRQLARDIDEMIERLQVLIDAQKRFIAHAAHELRSPLTTLYGELSHALRRSRSPEEYRRAIEEALESTRRLRALTEDLLAMARADAVARAGDTPVELADAVTEAIAWVTPEAREAGVAIEAAPGSATVRGEASDLMRLLRNLLENAVRHSPRGGTVHLRGEVRAGAVTLTIRDEGPGVPEDEREQIFEPFYRGAPDRARADTGTGLGLAIARSIARTHGGDLTLQESARGACFALTLPLLHPVERHA